MIHSTNSFRMEFNIHHQTQFDTKNISCAPRGNAIPKPATWKLKNGVGNLEGKHLLVFHLLPQTASIRYEGGNHKGKLGEGRPKCDLFIRFVILFNSSGDSTKLLFFSTSQKATSDFFRSTLKQRLPALLQQLQQPQQTRMPHHHQLRKPQLHDHSKRLQQKQQRLQQRPPKKEVKSGFGQLCFLWCLVFAC